MKGMWWLILLALVPSLGAQQPRQRPDSARRAELRAEVERRFAERVKQELQLTDQQAARLRATHERYSERRRPLVARQRALRMALHDEMKPGEAADADSVEKLLKALQDGREDLLEIEQAEDREMAEYLTPVQRARFQMMRQRFMERVRDVRRGRDGERMRHGPGGGARDRGGRLPTD
jgi:Spy/CpxP family protein refolding chaperone